MSQRNRHGNAWVNVLVVIGCLIILACLFLPATRNVREASRRMACSSNIRQFGIAVLGYEYSYKKLPGQCAGFGLPNPAFDHAPEIPSAGRWTGLIGFLPFLESNTFFNEIDSGYSAPDTSGEKINIGPYGQASKNEWYMPSDTRYHPACSQIGFFRCPSDPGRTRTKDMQGVIGRTNYVFNLADSQVGQNTIDIDQVTTRGPFMRGQQFTLAMIKDGTSNTIMFGEIATPDRDLTKPRNLNERTARVQGVVLGELSPDPSNPIQGIDVMECRSKARAGNYFDAAQKSLHEVRGTRWLDALACYTGFTTILGPNAASCSPASDPEGDGIYSAGSYHFGGAHVVMFDNAVRFIPNEIDNQNSNDSERAYYAPGIHYEEGSDKWQTTENWDKPSPFGVWGAMGTIASEDEPPDNPD
jgi:Protein of unknown function (DUF1559)